MPRPFIHFPAGPPLAPAYTTDLAPSLQTMLF